MTPLQASHSARQAIMEMRVFLLKKYGWTGLNISATVNSRQKAVDLEGQYSVSSQVRLLIHHLRLSLPSDWAIRTTLLTAKSNGGSRLLSADITKVFHRYPSSGLNNRLATEYKTQDGPVEVIVEVQGSMLIRGIDATVGWTLDQLGLPCPAPTLPLPNVTPELLYPAVERFLGTPYLRGGTTIGGMDCSGMVQRVYREVFGVILPRHSRDQKAFAQSFADSKSQETGDLIFGVDNTNGDHHVGIIVNNLNHQVFHASSCRKSVVNDSFHAFSEKVYITSYVSQCDIRNAYSLICASGCCPIPLEIRHCTGPKGKRRPSRLLNRTNPQVGR